MSTTEYTVRRHADDKEIGTANLTAEQFRHFKAMRQPEGIRLGALPQDYYDLFSEYQDTGENVIVYID